MPNGGGMSGYHDYPEREPKPMMTLKFTKGKDTKNYTLYSEDGNPMNRLYLPKRLPDKLEVVVQEVTK